MNDPRRSTSGDSDCCCSSLSDLAAVPMGGDGLDERVSASIEIVRNHGGGLWWLYLARCDVCGQHWLVAQEERIFDEYFLRRLTVQQAGEIIDAHRWPAEFSTYERVLKVGHAFARPCIFLDPLAHSLVATAQDLRKERPDISESEIAELLGVSTFDVARLLTA